jgi:hypothetical protein
MTASTVIALAIGGCIIWFWAWVTGRAAAKRNRSVHTWRWLGGFFGLWALIAVCLMGNKTPFTRVEPEPDREPQPPVPDTVRLWLDRPAD